MQCRRRRATAQATAAAALRRYDPRVNPASSAANAPCPLAWSTPTICFTLREALQIAEQIAAETPLAVVATRFSVLKVLEEGPQAAMREFDSTQKRLANSEDAKEGVSSFVENRSPNFVGR